MIFMKNLPYLRNVIEHLYMLNLRNDLYPRQENMLNLKLNLSQLNQNYLIPIY